MNQFELIRHVILSPKLVFQLLPDNRVLWLGWLAPFYFGVARFYRPGTYESALNYVGNEYLLFVLVSLFALVMIPVGAAIIKFIVMIFGKRLTVRKLMNIYGYALVPRILAAMVVYVILLIEPDALQSGQLNGYTLAIIGVGTIGLLYTLVLYIYALVVSPSTEA